MKQYKVFKVCKGNGKFRTIYAPFGEYKTELQNLVSILESKASKLDAEGVIQGFAKGKSCVTNAISHIGHKFALTMDLESFFDSVTPVHVKGLLNKKEIEMCFIDGVARQGLPTSPCVANIAFVKCDKAIIKALKKNGIQAIYTRYADDLTFSYDTEEHHELIKNLVTQVVTKAGFKVNKSKTKVQDSRNGNIIITGVGVTRDGVRPTRKTLRKIRAAIHQNKKESLQGLIEWSKCKKPKEKVKSSTASTLYGLSQLWGMGVSRKMASELSPKETVELGDNCRISGDPIDMLGMSTFTTGWTSCMARNGEYKKGVAFWLMLKGTQVAYQYSDKDISFGSITRKKMICRCLIHTLRNGQIVYDRIYGNNCGTLIEQLQAHGVIPIQLAEKGVKVVGNVSSKKKVWCDNLRIGKGRDTKTHRVVRFVHT